MGRQNNKLLENIRKYEQKEKEIKKKVHACTTHNGVKVYAVWYE